MNLKNHAGHLRLLSEHLPQRLHAATEARDHMATAEQRESP
ncbi:hypothetical protein ACWEO2_16485 [Nocardia sp. NPDC004278]